DALPISGPHARHVAPMSSTNDLTSSSGCPTHMTSSAEWSAQWRCQLAANKSVWLMNLSLLHLRSSTVRHVNALGVIPRRPSCIAIKRALLPGDAVAQGRNVIQVLGCKPGQVLPGMPGLGGPSDDGQVRRHRRGELQESRQPCELLFRLTAEVVVVEPVHALGVGRE